jgi:hypothetical protein
VDVVTASPYHSAGSVENVPWWRKLSTRVGALLYRLVFRRQVHTYGSGLQVYRRSALVETKIGKGRLMKVSEMLERLEEAGARIVEHPVTLETRARPSPPRRSSQGSPVADGAADAQAGARGAVKLGRTV